jgi:hypothetical protein
MIFNLIKQGSLLLQLNLITNGLTNRQGSRFDLKGIVSQDGLLTETTGL